MRTQYIIRPEISEDSKGVSKVVKRAFAEGPRGYHGEAELVEKIRVSSGYLPELSLIALDDEKIVGHILLSRVYLHTDGKKIPTLILAPVSVLPEYQNKGIGGELIEAAHKEALSIGEQHVFLLGHAKYYPKFGYGPSREFGIVFPDGMDNDSCMGIELITGSLDASAGALAYSQPFYEI